MSNRLSEIIDFLDGNEPNDVDIYSDQYLEEALEVVNYIRDCITAMQKDRELEREEVPTCCGGELE